MYVRRAPKSMVPRTVLRGDPGEEKRYGRLHFSPLTPSLLLKVVLTPALIATATLVGRRWGETMSGWLVGLPLTSAPVVFFLALDQGTTFATTASLAILLGTISQAAFAVAYARVAGRAGWSRGRRGLWGGFFVLAIFFVGRPRGLAGFGRGASCAWAPLIALRGQASPLGGGRPPEGGPAATGLAWQSSSSPGRAGSGSR